MIDLYYWPTQNGRKISIFLEEAELPYRVVPINIRTGEQFAPEFVEISPNGKIPAIVDHESPDGGAVAIFESGAILLYLAEKTGRYVPTDVRGRFAVIQWLMFQMASIGPMVGQQVHFRRQAPENIPYAITRYTQEVCRLLDVCNKRLDAAEFFAGEYTVADMACYPWIEVAARHNPEHVKRLPNLMRWLNAIATRPAVARAMSILEEHARPRT